MAVFGFIPSFLPSFLTYLKPVCNAIPVKLTSQDPPFNKDSFHRIITHGEPNRTFTSLPQTVFPYFSQQNLFFLLPPLFSSLELYKHPPKDKQDFNRFQESSSLIIFPFQRKFRDFPILKPLLPQSQPKGTCSFNRP